MTSAATGILLHFLLLPLGVFDLVQKTELMAELKARVIRDQQHQRRKCSHSGRSRACGEREEER